MNRHQNEIMSFQNIHWLFWVIEFKCIIRYEKNKAQKCMFVYEYMYSDINLQKNIPKF